MFWMIILVAAVTFIALSIGFFVQAKCGTIGQMTRARDVDGLLELLQNDDASLFERSDAARALSKMADPRTVELFIK